MKYRLRESSRRHLQGQCPPHDISDTQSCSFCMDMSSHGALTHSPGSWECGEGKDTKRGPPVLTAQGPEFGDVHSLVRKPRQLALVLRPTSSCLTPAPCHFSPTATWNPHPGHPQEPVEHGREPHAHQVSETPHLCAALPASGGHRLRRADAALVMAPALTQSSCRCCSLARCRAPRGR